MPTLTIALGQMRIKLADARQNLATATDMISQAAADSADIILLPELWATGYDLENAHDHADKLGEGIFAQVSAAAGENEIAVYGSLLEKNGVGVMNCATCYDKAGELRAVYRKIHLFRLFDEHLWLSEGESPALLEMDQGAAGLAICYDLRFPELFRRYAVSHGAGLMLLCAEWPHARVAHWRALLQARAIENQCFVAAVNSCGDTGGTTFGGHSVVIDPWGKIIAEAGADECLLTAQIDMDEVAKVRRAIPAFEDRRPDAYLEGTTEK